MSKPLISIVIPCYNMGNLLQETLDSVTRLFDIQKHEVLVVNDGSSDEITLRILESIRDFRVINKPNGGLASARNAGIKEAKGDYVLLLDADNLLTDGYLTQGAAVLNEHPDVDIVYGDLEIFGDKGGVFQAEPFSLQTLMSYNYIDACCLVRRSVFDELGGFDGDMPVQGFEDWEMWLRAACNNKRFHYLEDVIVQKYRVRNDSMIRVVSKKDRDKIFDYLQQKYPYFLNFSGVSDFYYGKFKNQTLGWTAKLFIKKYFPRLHEKLIGKGKISKYL